MTTLLHTESSTGLGGQEIRTLREAVWTIERGWRVVVACQPGSRMAERGRAAGLRVLPVRMRAAWDVLAVARLVRIVRREHVSVVHTHSSVDGWLGGIAARITRVPVVRTRHVSIPIRSHWNPVYRRLADRVITSGEAIRRQVLAAGVPAAHVVPIAAGVDLREYRPGPRAQGLARELGLEGPIIGSVAMFRGSKGHSDLLDAFRLVREEHPRARLLLVGDGTRRRQVEELAVEGGVRDAVVFTGLREDVPALLSIMDCFVLASTRTEGIPQSLLQAFASEVPVVATAIGGIPEVVDHERTGILVPPGDPCALAKGIRAVLVDRAGALARAGAARELVAARFSRDAALDRLLAVYEDVLRGRPSRGRRAE